MISLAEAVKLKSILLKKQNELMMERHRVAFVVVEKGTKAFREGRTIELVTAQLSSIRDDIRLLDKLVYEANITHAISYKEESYTLVEAIELAKQLRVEANELRQLSYSEKEQIEFGYTEHVPMVRVALFEPQQYAEKADELERIAHKISNLINERNYTIKIAFDDSHYM